MNQSSTQQNQSYERSAKKITTKPRRFMHFENNHSHDSATLTDTITETQDHAKSPQDSQQCDELNRMKKKALIFKTQS